MKIFIKIFLVIYFARSLVAGSGTDWQSSPLSIDLDQVIEVTPPEGTRRIKMEFKNPESGNWELLNTGHLPDTKTGKLYFKIPKKIKRSQVRFLSSKSEIIPFSMLQGRSSFGSRTGNSDAYATMRMATMDESVSESQDGDDQVQESDLWRIIGDKLFYFNQFRGLQIIDLSYPERPEVTGRHRLPASGEQMYVANDGKYAFLIVRKAHQSWPYQSEIRILKTEEQQIIEIERLELGGHYRESRLIDGILYVVSEKWEQEKVEHDGWQFSYSTYLQSFDMNNPERPILLDQQVIPGAPQVISATNQTLTLVTRDPRNYYYKHVVRVFDLSARNGIPEISAQVYPGGRVLDKFKLRISNGILTVISQAYRNGNWSNRYSLLENFDLRSEELISSLDLAERETLYATNFDGNYAYIVTFLQTDPLFVIDLSDPFQPKVVSELIVPGWSEYIKPLGDQLFAVGVEEGRVTASLFDLSNKTNPFLSDRIYLGDENGYSWSEANYDEKAIGQFESLDTFLVPFQSWDENAYKNRIQILEIQNSKFVERGTIEHRFQARRSSPDTYGTKIFSVSGNELLVTDFANRDNPRLLKSFPLAWQVDEVLPLSDWLIQLENIDAYSWGWTDDDSNATLRTTSMTDPDLLISSFDLGKGRLVGSAQNEDLIHLAMIEDDILKVMILKANEQGVVEKIGQSKVSTKLNAYDCRMQFLVLDENNFCWASSKNESDPYFFYHDNLILRRSMIADRPYLYSYSKAPEVHIFSHETTFDKVSITHDSNTTLVLPQNSEWSEPILLGKMLLYGTKNTNLSYHPENTWQVVNSEINSSLHRIDLSDFSKPIALEPLPAPGMLVGAKQFFLGSTEAKLFMESRDSAIDFFRPWARSMDTQEFGRSLTACAFDGTNLFFLDEMKVENSHLGISVMNDLLLVPQEKAKGYGLQTFTLDKSGLFQEQNQWFKEKQLIDYAIFQSMVLARTDQEILFANLNFSDPSIDWQESKLSGNFVPNLDQFVTANSQIFIPSGSYGVEVLELQEVIESPERRVLPNRRNASQSEDWQSVETSRLRIFDTEFTPVLFSTLNSSGWKFRPDSIFDADVIELDASWKKSPWFGNFYERGYPWVYHSKLGWSYVQENTTGEFWLWRSETGWTWSSNEIFPHLFSDSLRGWVYFDINEDRKKLRIYDFTTMHWREE